MSFSASALLEKHARNGHVDSDSIKSAAIASIEPPSPATFPNLSTGIDSVWSSLIEIAKKAGRADLIEEFQRRSAVNNEPSANKATIAADPSWSENSVEEKKKSVSLGKEGLKLLRAGKMPQAIEKFQHALALDFDNHDAHANLGCALASSGRKADAERSFKEALRLLPTHAITHDNLGIIYTEGKRFVEAEKAFREAIRLVPKESLYHRRLAKALEGLGQSVDTEVGCRQAHDCEILDGRNCFVTFGCTCDRGLFSSGSSGSRCHWVSWCWDCDGNWCQIAFKMNYRKL